MRFQYIVFDTEPNGSSRCGRVSPSSTKGNSSSSALDLPAVFWPRRINRPSENQNS